MYTNSSLQRLATLYGWIVSAGSNLQSLFLLWMRFTWGHQFILAGFDKLAHIEQTIQYFTSLNIIFPVFHAHLVGASEIFFGALLFIGFMSRLAAIPLIVMMVTALGLAHTPVFENYRFIADPSSLVNEAPYPFLITALLVLIFGPGKVSVDHFIKRWVDKQPTY